MKDEIVKEVCGDMDVKELDIRTVVMQDLLWPGFCEIRAFAADGTVYTALYQDGIKLKPFMVAPKREEVSK